MSIGGACAKRSVNLICKSRSVPTISRSLGPRHIVTGRCPASPVHFVGQLELSPLGLAHGEGLWLLDPRCASVIHSCCSDSRHGFCGGFRRNRRHHPCDAEWSVSVG